MSLFIHVQCHVYQTRLWINNNDTLHKYQGITISIIANFRKIHPKSQLASRGGGGGGGGGRLGRTINGLLHLIGVHLKNKISVPGGLVNITVYLCILRNCNCKPRSWQKTEGGEIKTEGSLGTRLLSCYTRPSTTYLSLDYIHRRKGLD